MERGGSYYYFHADGLRSITQTNAVKAVAQSYTYDAYGMATPTTSFRNSYQRTGRVNEIITKNFSARSYT